jgi:asparagine synthase (glutamine-hydrolysing)
MCGIAGIVRTDPAALVEDGRLRRMAGAIEHRGPDGFGLAVGEGLGLVSTRLAIIDVPFGWQPQRGRDGSLLVYNGEVYNHVELRRELLHTGPFENDSDTEVVLRLLERHGQMAMHRFNGQFALAWWQPERRRLTLARDRFGVRPLYYSVLGDGGLAFASEAKALFASGEVVPEPDLPGIDEVFTLWAPRAPTTAFRGVRQLPAGGVLVWEDGRIVQEGRWWEPGRLAGDGDDAGLLDLLRDSVRLRLRSDVPVGAYLSGGLDSSLITALANEVAGERLQTFSVAFRDPVYDERGWQEQVARQLDTTHHVVEVGPDEIAEAFPAVVRSCETPLVRTAPVPLWLLSRAARAHGITVVLTGEGADELFWGYDLFKEVALRELHARDPERAATLVDKLYPELAGSPGRRGPAWRRFLLESGDHRDPLGSHRTRATATGAVRGLYRPEVAAAVAAADPLAGVWSRLPAGFSGWPALERAAYMEISVLLGDHLLSAQGDRVGMANGVEGRYPFLDHRVFELAAGLPHARKLDGLRDKVAVRDAAARVLPPAIAERRKQPYKAPEIAPFFTGDVPDWVGDRLSGAALRDVGIFDEARVEGLLRRCRSGRATSPREGMALVGVLSTQVWHEELCARSASSYEPERAEPRVLLDDHPYTLQRNAA